VFFRGFIKIVLIKSKLINISKVIKCNLELINRKELIKLIIIQIKYLLSYIRMAYIKNKKN